MDTSKEPKGFGKQDSEESKTQAKRVIQFVGAVIAIVGVSYVLWRVVLADITNWKYALGILLVTYAVMTLIWQLPKWQVSKWKKNLNPAGVIEIKDFLAAENSARSTLAQILGGIFVFTGLYFTATGLKNSSSTLELSRQGQITERYTKGVQQLSAKDQPDVVIGGIYTLGRIPKESPTDHWSIMEVLTAYVRRAAPVDRQVLECNITESPEDVLSVAVRPNVQAVMHVLRQRNVELEKDMAEKLNLEFSDLARVNLRGATLNAALFDSSILKGGSLDDNASLKGASFQYANLAYTSFAGAKLQTAVFAYAKCLRGTDFTGADLTGADFRGSNFLVDTNFTNAVMNDADFSNLDLSKVVGLKKEQLQHTKLFGTTLPAYLNQ
jgi:hypothetical protein